MSMASTRGRAARVSVEVAEGQHLNIERLQELCLKALQTETQVMVKREDNKPSLR